jgi:hypothetical protein
MHDRVHAFEAFLVYDVVFGIPEKTSVMRFVPDFRFVRRKIVYAYFMRRELGAKPPAYESRRSGNQYFHLACFD